jgi:nicotinamidase-related amidase
LTPQITVVPRETALLVVDMQNGFCDPKGSMALA